MKLLLSTLLVLSLVTAASADQHREDYKNRNATHAGEVDTDGILSPGEIPNRNINYDRAQQQGEWRGDSRYNNSINDQAANRDQNRDSHNRDWNSGRGDDRGYGSNRGWGNNSGDHSFGPQNQYGSRKQELTERELRDIHEMQRELSSREQAYRADGYLSPGERADLESRQSSIQSNIDHNLRDGEHR